MLLAVEDADLLAFRELGIGGDGRVEGRNSGTGCAAPLSV